MKYLPQIWPCRNGGSTKKVCHHGHLTFSSIAGVLTLLSAITSPGRGSCRGSFFGVELGFNCIFGRCNHSTQFSVQKKCPRNESGCQTCRQEVCIGVLHGMKVNSSIRDPISPPEMHSHRTPPQCSLKPGQGGIQAENRKRDWLFCLIYRFRYDI